MKIEKRTLYYVVLNFSPRICILEFSQISHAYLFWYQVFTWGSVMLSCFASAVRSIDARYFCLEKRFSNSAT